MSHYNKINATKRLTKTKSLFSPKNSNHKPKDVVANHMGTQLVELNETIH
jgi:hypothetical protein